MDFLILKVNGQDVSSCSHEEAVAVLSQASQPILVEVRTRPPSEDVAGPSKLSQEVQTDFCDNWTSERTYYNYTDSHQHTEEQFLCPELQYEEIELKRPQSSPSELLGLTLCYEDEDEEGNTEIFIDDIHPLGLAARDGRLRLGDQIIQIQGERVRSKSRAQELFRTLRGDVSLLVVRPPNSAQGYDDDLDNLLDLSQSLSQSQAGEEEYKAQLSKNRLSSTSSKDSGHTSGSMDRTSTGSSQSSQSSARDGKEEDLAPRPPLHTFSKSNQKPSDCMYSTDSEFYYVDGKLQEIDDFYREVKNAERLIEPGRENVSVVIDPVYEIIPEVSDGDELYCLPHDSKPSSKQENSKLRNKSQEKIKSICRSISSPMKMNEFLQNKVRRSTSNYRQSDQQGVDIKSWLPLNNNNNNNNNNTVSLQPHVRSQQSSSLRLTASSLVGGGSSLTLLPSKPSSDIMYTNISNLQRTMKDQQEALLHQLHQPQFVAPPPPSQPPPSQPDTEQHWEWRIKVRPDGSRYIARRPTRTFLLRQREKQIVEERSGGFTSDDDAASEVKVGKFWTRDQRKKHLEDSKERRRRQEELIKAKNSVKVAGESGKRHSYHEPSTNNKNNEILLTVATV